ncbi:MAG TPA: hypothetical protein VJZ93_02475 [Candidatus Nanoarchaeia archaeon]|nr:hypothetical protein [Candidatus Nanoarchaeia archaeon]
MGIKVEFNSELALRNFGEEGRLPSECLPKELDIGTKHFFTKKGQRNYFLEGEIPLVRTNGNGEISGPLANVKILEVSHFLRKGEPYTRGVYEVISVYDTSKNEILLREVQKAK